MKSDKIQVVAYIHPIKSDRVVKEYDRSSIKEIIDDLKISVSPENLLIFDGDQKVKDLNHVPVTNNLYIRCLPEGGDNLQESLETGGNITKIAGAAIVLGAALAIFTGGFSLALGATVLGGLGVIGGGIYLYNLAGQLDSSGLKRRNTPSIRGSKNQSNPGGRVPILLGKHLVYPMLAAQPYTTILEQGENAPDLQRIYQLMCAGYKDMYVDTSTYKVGDVRTTELTDTQIELHQAGEALNLYGDRRIQINVNKEVETSNPSDQNVIIVTTPTNTLSVQFNFVAQNGIGKQKKKNLGRVAVSPRWQIKNAADPDSAYVTWPEVVYRKPAKKYTFRWSNFPINPTERITPDSQRQYTFRVYRNSSKSSDSKVKDTYHLESIVCTTADFTENPPDTKPVPDNIRSKLTLLETRFLSSQIIRGTVDEFNFEGTLRAPTYSGTGTGPTQWQTITRTSNPASCFLYVLRDNLVSAYPIEDTQVDWPTFEAWYQFCAAQDFECNMYLNEDITFKDILDQITILGRATWTVLDGKYSIIIDNERTNIIQYFTPRNSSNFEGNKTFSDVTTGMRMKFINTDNAYAAAERVVFADGTEREVLDTDNIQDYDINGAVTPTHAAKLGKYFLACNELRPETYSFDTDIEYVFCTRGDRIAVNHDIPLFGLSSGRIQTLIELSGDTTGFVSDEVLRFEQGKTYGVTIRFQTGAQTYPITNPTTSATPVDTQSILFVTPITGTTTLNVDDLFMFGESGEETVDLLVTEISPSSDLSAKITAINYDERVYTSADSAVPVYNPRISLPGDSGPAIRTGDVSDVDEYIREATINVIDTYQLADRVNEALTGGIPEGMLITETSGYRPKFLSANDLEGEIIYVNTEDRNTIYRRNVSDVSASTGTKLTNIASDWLDTFNDTRIVYTNQSDDSRIYIKTNNTLETGTALTTNSAASVTTDDSNNIYYINYNDGNKIYKTDESSADGTLLLDLAVVRISHVEDDQLLYIRADNGQTYIKNDSDTEEGDLTLDHNAFEISPYNENSYIYIQAETGIMYAKAYEDTVTDNLGTPLYNNVSTMDGYLDDVVFSSTNPQIAVQGGLLSAPSDGRPLNKTLDINPMSDSFTITGTITTGSQYIMGISADDLNLIARNDVNVDGLFPTNTLVQFVGPGYLFMSGAATSTIANTTIVFQGSRIYLNANKVVAPGSIEARHLRASAIDSKALTDTSERISEFNLDEGTQIFRRQDGTEVLNFDPTRTGSELTITGSISLQNNAVGADQLQDGAVGRAKLSADAIQSTSMTTEVTPNPRYSLDLATGRRIVRQANGTVVVDENPDAGTFTFKGDITGATGRFSGLTGSLLVSGTQQSLTPLTLIIPAQSPTLLFVVVTTPGGSGGVDSKAANVYFYTTTPSEGVVQSYHINEVVGNISTDPTFTLSVGSVNMTIAAEIGTRNWEVFSLNIT